VHGTAGRGACMHSLSNLEMRDAAMQWLGCVCMRMINSPALVHSRSSSTSLAKR
jgi:hypothetical protein